MICIISLKWGGRKGLVYHHCKIWVLRLRWLKASPPIHAHTPLWDNSNLPELLTLPDVDIWINQGGIYLLQVMNSAGVKLFQDLKPTFGLPNSMLFRFLQLRHALQSQFRNSTPDLFFISCGRSPGSRLEKKLTSICYSNPILPAASDLTCELKSSWVVDVEEDGRMPWQPASWFLQSFLTGLHTYVYTPQNLPDSN